MSILSIVKYEYKNIDNYQMAQRTKQTYKIKYILL